MHALDDARTPRELARALLYPYVERGDTVVWLAHGGLAAGSLAYSVAIGAWMGNRDHPRKLTCWRIGVSRFASQPCDAVFSLQEIYDEIAAEIASGGVTQLSLFG